MSRLIEFVFRVHAETEDDSVLDDIIQHGSEILFPNYYDEDETFDGPKLIYEPVESHWKEIDRFQQAAEKNLRESKNEYSKTSTRVGK